MGITLRTSPKAIMAETARQLQAIENGIVNRLDLTGAEFMDQAKRDLNIDRSAFPTIRKQRKRRGVLDPPRGAGEYLDDSKALRGSIGYYVLQNGAIIRGRVEGPAEATSAAMTVLQQVPKVNIGYQLIGVAGMEYASYLESRGFNVITSQGMVALTNVEQRLRRLATARGAAIDVDMTGVQTAMR